MKITKRYIKNKKIFYKIYLTTGRFKLKDLDILFQEGNVYLKKTKDVIPNPLKTHNCHFNMSVGLKKEKLQEAISIILLPPVITTITASHFDRVQEIISNNQQTCLAYPIGLSINTHILMTTYLSRT